jgi:hypothetical protein
MILRAKKRLKPHGVGPIAPGYQPSLNARDLSLATFVQAVNTVEEIGAQGKEFADLILNKLSAEQQEQAIQAAAMKLATEENKKDFAPEQTPTPEVYVPTEEDEEFFEEVLKETFAKTDTCQEAGCMCDDCGDDRPLQPMPTVEMLRQEYEKLDDEALNDHVAAALLATGLEDMLLDGVPVKEPKAKRKPAKKKAAKKRK